jgi:hypothetical protein
VERWVQRGLPPADREGDGWVFEAVDVARRPPARENL